MRQAKRVRYYCDHCGRGGFYVNLMTKHEEGCTLNPNRRCRFCEAVGDTQASMADMKAALLEDIAADEHPKYRYELLIPRLREAAYNCPACILAAIRQTPEMKEHYADFQFTVERDEFWQAQNERETHSPLTSCGEYY